MRRLATLVVVVGLLVPAPSASASEPVNQTLQIGTSFRGVPIYAYRRNAVNPARRVLVVGNVHGDERAGIRVVDYLRGHGGGFQRDVEVWLVPTLNPDGNARGTRQNARGVDLNRNFPWSWTYDPTPKYHSGPGATSEPETRAMVSFLKRYRPRTLIAFHQPLQCVDTTTSPQATSSIMGRNTGLPLCRLGPRHGSQTDYAHALTSGSVAMTVEFGANPATRTIEGAVTGVRQVANIR